MRVFRITFKGVKLDLALTEQGDSKSNSKKPGLTYIQYIVCYICIVHSIYSSKSNIDLG